MTKLMRLLFLLLLTGFSAGAQSLHSIDSSKYRIDLPEYWKPGNKIWRILSDRLPEVCPELSNKELCGDDCNPWLRIAFEMSDPVIYDYLPNHISSNSSNEARSKPYEVWDIQTAFGFECSLLLVDNKGKIFTRFILVDTNETWRVTNRVSLTAYTSAPLPSTAVRRTAINPRPTGTMFDPNTVNNQSYMPVSGQEGETPYSYINNNKEKLRPSIKDLLLVVDRKINSW